MDNALAECILDHDDLDVAATAAACHAALTLIESQMATAETDIPWADRDQWPPEVVSAAVRLPEFVPETARGEEYMLTDVTSVADPEVRADFIQLAPYAYDATFWRSDGSEIASLADEGDCVVWLTKAQLDALTATLGAPQFTAVAASRRVDIASPLHRLGNLRPRRS